MPEKFIELLFMAEAVAVAVKAAPGHGPPRGGCPHRVCVVGPDQTA